MATTLNNLVGLYYRQGKNQKAPRAFERIITIFGKVLGPDHPNLAVAIGNYAAILGKLGRDDEAAQWTVKAEAIQQRRICRKLESPIGRGLWRASQTMSVCDASRDYMSVETTCRSALKIRSWSAAAVRGWTRSVRNESEPDIWLVGPQLLLYTDSGHW